MSNPAQSSTQVRLDKWLWAARFYKTRSLARDQIDGGKVHYNGQRSKPGKAVEVGATDAYAETETALPGNLAFDAVQALKRDKNFDYLRQDINTLLTESRDGLDRVKTIVQGLKDFSRIGAMQWEWASLNHCIDTTLKIVWNELKYKCTVIKDYANYLPEINCLPAQINQVVMNLLVNAGQAIDVKGEITICTRLKGEDSVQILVTDNGKGIPPENLQHIFEPFFTTKPIGKGTGLGLSIVWGIIVKHHGEIAVDSVVGKGTTFTVTLPINAAALDEGRSTQAMPSTVQGDNGVSPAPTE